MHINKKRLGRGAFVVMSAGTLAVLATGLLPVAAQVIGDPLGLISIGTSGESTSGSTLAVSNGGNASGGTNGAGLSTSGTATGGLVAASGTGCAVTGNTYAYAPLAVSGTGCAGGQGTTVSGTGPACGSGLIGVSLADASCGLVAISGDGNPNGTYSANGSGAIRAEGNSLDTTNLAVTSGAAGLGIEEEGVSYRPVDDQLQYVGSHPPADVMAAKEAGLASVTPIVNAELAACQAGCPLGATVTTPRYTAGTCSTCPAPHSMSLVIPSNQYRQFTNYTCGPSATRMAAWFITGSDPGEGTAETYRGHNTWSGGSGVAGTEATHGPMDSAGDGSGTDVGGVVHGLGVYAPNGGYWSHDQPTDAAGLMDIVVTDVAYGAQASSSNPNPASNELVVLDTAPNPYKLKSANGVILGYWAGHQSGGHYIPVHGYNMASGGQLELFDEFDPSMGSFRAPYGDHWVPLTEAYNSMHQKGMPGTVIW
jgi:hypothetical protein